MSRSAATSTWLRSPRRATDDVTLELRRELLRQSDILGSPALAARVGGARIDREERKGRGASDHAPVVVDLRD
ncbi:hypothetical protein [Geodermatophilus obscurus]|nr:hypothetical protein [Geodermatophilus obscurus]